MKNIRILTTKLASRLIIDTIENKLYFQPILHEKTINVLPQHIYITSDEKFVRDEYITDGLEVTKATPKLVDAQGLIDRRDWKKIILTTDQDLIKDGVQAIPDEFLEWFVKNPSCEEVKVEKEFIQTPDYLKDGFYYKIITKEEPKQEIELVNGFIPTSVFDKKETLEEFINSQPYYGSCTTEYLEGIEEGAKWQQEQIGKSEFLQKLRATKSDAEARRLIFEQFKNK
jgi:hypothetical protein